MPPYLKHITLLLLFLSLGACTTSRFIHHAPIESNHQKLQEQYDLKLSGSILNEMLQGTKDLNKNFQLSFSPVKALGLQVGRHSFTSNNVISSIPTTYIESWKGALGGYHFFEFKQKERKRKIGKQRKHLLPKGLLIDLYSGMEWKEIDHNGFERFGNGNRRALLKSQNLFLEGGAQYQSKHFGIGSTLKFNALRFYDGTFYYRSGSNFLIQTQESKLLDHFLIIKNNDRQYNFMEGSIYLIIGDKRVNFYAGYHRSFQPRNSLLNNVPHIAYAGINLSIDSFYDPYLKKKRATRSKKKR